MCTEGLWAPAWVWNIGLAHRNDSDCFRTDYFRWSDVQWQGGAGLKNPPTDLVRCRQYLLLVIAEQWPQFSHLKACYGCTRLLDHAHYPSGLQKSPHVDKDFARRARPPTASTAMERLAYLDEISTIALQWYDSIYNAVPGAYKRKMGYALGQEVQHDNLRTCLNKALNLTEARFCVTCGFRASVYRREQEVKVSPRLLEPPVNGDPSQLVDAYFCWCTGYLRPTNELYPCLECLSADDVPDKLEETLLLRP